MESHMSGKGSNPRPFDIPWDKYATNFDLIFGRDNEKKNKAQDLVNEHKHNHSCNSGGSDNPQGQAGQAQNDGVLST